MVELLDRATAAEYASWFRALADPSRVQLVALLARHGGPMSVGEIVVAMGLAQSTVSQHLKILKEAGLVSGEVDGPKVCYCVDPDGLARLKALVAAV